MILDLLIAESQKNMQFQRELENKISRLPKGTIKARRVKEKPTIILPI